MTTHNAHPNFGCQQSPIDFDEAEVFDTSDLGIEVTWTTLQVEGVKARKFAVTKADGVLIRNGERYIPIDFHWHLPAEHTHGGEKNRHPAEVHVVHVHEDDIGIAGNGFLDWLRIAVIGVYIESGKTSYAPFELEAQLIDADGKPKKGASGTISRDAAFPERHTAFRYNGGLTTPPYSENVTFFIFGTPASGLPGQFDNGGRPNARALQSVNRRVVAKGDVKLSGNANS